MNRDHGIVGTLPHDILYCEQQPLTKLPAGMEPRVILFRQALHLHERDRNGVPHSKCGGGARRGCKIQVAGFSNNLQVQHKIG